MEGNADQEKMCSSCERAHFLRDKGYPEEVFIHCYDEGCSCGCFARKPDAILIAKDWYIKKATEHNLKTLDSNKKS
jgi:hypothetical protein